MKKVLFSLALAAAAITAGIAFSAPKKAVCSECWDHGKRCHFDSECLGSCYCSTNWRGDGVCVNR